MRKLARLIENNTVHGIITAAVRTPSAAPSPCPCGEIVVAIQAVTGGPTHKPSSVMHRSTQAAKVARIRSGARV